MGPRIVYRAAKKEDAATLADKMRLSDIRELVAVHGEELDIKELLERSIKEAHHAAVAENTKRELLAIFGVSVCNKEANIASPWMLCAEKADEFSRELVRDGRRFVDEWRREFKGLINFVDARNTTSIRWLMRIGFKIHEPIKYGKMGLPFHPFTL